MDKEEREVLADLVARIGVTFERQFAGVIAYFKEASTGPELAALIVSNTTITRPALESENAEETGGLSGAPLRDLALAREYLSARYIDGLGAAGAQAHDPPCRRGGF